MADLGVVGFWLAAMVQKKSSHAMKPSASFVIALIFILGTVSLRGSSSVHLLLVLLLLVWQLLVFVGLFRLLLVMVWMVVMGFDVPSSLLPVIKILATTTAVAIAMIATIKSLL